MTDEGPLGLGAHPHYPKTTQHTPGPWRTLFRTDKLLNIIAEDTWIATDVEPANAEFIIRAVNSHEDLLAALGQMVAWCDDLVFENGDHFAEQFGEQVRLDFAAEGDKARAAIAKARGET